MKRHSFDLLVVVVLFVIYAASASLLCVIGAEVYRETALTMQRDYDQRTSTLYLAEKVRQNDCDSAFRIDRVGDASALVLIEQQSGSQYETWLFVQDRKLYEGLFAPGDAVDVRLCQPIMPMDELTFEQDDGLLSARFHTVDGQVTNVTLAVRSQRTGSV
jgi:hypothetical protein